MGRGILLREKMWRGREKGGAMTLILMGIG